MRTCHRHYPGRSDGACSLVPLHRQRPSLCKSQVGSCNYCFGACSAFTLVMACTLAESPNDPFHRKLRQLRCLHCRFDCYRVERTSSRAGVAPAEVQRLFTAHCFANCCAATALRWPSTAVAAASSCATMTFWSVRGRTRRQTPALPSSVALLDELGITFIAAEQSAGQRPRRTLWGILRDRTSPSRLRLAQALISIPPTPGCTISWRTTTSRFTAGRGSAKRMASRLQ